MSAPASHHAPGPIAWLLVTAIAGAAVGGYETFEPLPRIVDGLQGRGFEMVTLDDLL